MIPRACCPSSGEAGRATVRTVSRTWARLVLTLALAACSGSSPASKDSPRGAPEAMAAPMVMAQPAGPAVPPPDPREAALSKVTLRLLQEQHLLHKTIDDRVSRTAFEAYLKALDGGKMFLLTPDREKLERYADQIDDELRAGQLALAHAGATVFAERVVVVDKLVAQLLAAPLDHSNEEVYEIDPDKVALAATEDALRDRWRQRLELEVLERVAQMEARLDNKDKPARGAATGKGAPKAVKQGPPTTPPAAADDDDDDRGAVPLAQIPATAEGREEKARTDIAKTYASRFARLRTPGALDAAADLVNAVASALDPHTTYMPPADKANFDIAMTGSLEGIGAVLRERDHYIEVNEIVPGGASYRQGGLGAGDLILSVASADKEPVDTFDLRIDEVVKMIRGPKGTVVRLRVQKPTGQEETIAITRDVVVIEEAYARGAVLERKGGTPVGYIHLPSFYGGRDSRTSARDVRHLLEEMQARKVAGVILDLRSNGGGLLSDAIEMTGDLIDQGPVVQVQDSTGKREVFDDDRRGTAFDGPVVVMVDKFSASASEIVAGALQDYGRAIIVGTAPTHGKGTVQTLADLDRSTGGAMELGVFKLTIQQFFRVSGASTQLKGVVPDILLPDPAGHIDGGERKLEHAIAWSEIAPASYKRLMMPWSVPTLVQSSASRVTRNPLLSKIARTTSVLKQRMADTRVPLAKPAWEARRTQQRAALEAASPDFKAAPAKFTVQVIADPAATALPPSGSGKPDDRLKRWGDALARDPWVDESVNVLADMK